MFNLIPASSYSDFYVSLMAILAILQSIKYISANDTTLVYNHEEKKFDIYAIILTIFFILFFGLRDPYSEYFADTIGYTGRFEKIRDLGEDSAWYDLIYNA
ncbi:MAG: hypothetical protein K2N03_01745, partial [Muribaculaceae bacterium]|nr:hypothetical protein [Muribaculaceae bacterium]